MANYPQELAQDAVCQSHTGHMTALVPAWPGLQGWILMNEYLVALTVYRASDVWIDACNSCSLLCISNSDWATENEAGRSVSFNGNEEPAGEICHQYSAVVTAVIP